MDGDARNKNNREKIFPEREPFPGVRLTKNQIQSYLEKLEASGCTPATVRTYRRNLERFYRSLPKGKYIQAGSLETWQTHLLESGYSAKTVNVFTAAANGLVLFLGYRRLQAERVEEEESIQPELTRNEYLRLLSTAKSQNKEKHYLLVKLIATTGISVSDVEQVTAQAVQDGKIPLSSGNLRIPAGLKEELLHFMGEEGITAGPVFVTRTGRPLDRTVVNSMIKTLCRDARVQEEKANPRCLRKLYQSTQAGIEENFSLLIEQAYDRLLDKEQDIIGW